MFPCCCCGDRALPATAHLTGELFCQRHYQEVVELARLVVRWQECNQLRPATYLAPSRPLARAA